MASDYYPLSKDDALKKGYKWLDEDKKRYKPQNYELPDDITDTADDILKEVLACANCGKNYKILPLELNFYRKMELCIPRNCQDCRRKERNIKVASLELWDRKCDKCSVLMRTSYKQGRPEKVYCEKCYLENVN